MSYFYIFMAWALALCDKPGWHTIAATIFTYTAIWMWEEK